jgi:RNA polymerase sigma-70 factor (ECF subfamily)
VARLLLGSVTQLRGVIDLRLERAEVNGQPGVLVRDADGGLFNVFAFDIADGAVNAVRSVINRDKLGHLGPLLDLPTLRARHAAARSAGSEADAE